MALATTSVLFAIASCPHDKTDTDNFDSNVEVITTCTATSTTTSTLQKTTTTESTMTTSVMTTTTASVNTPVIETQPYVVEVATEVAVQPVEQPIGDYPISESDYILIANVVSHEAGSSWISTYNRSQIVAAIMNRVADSRFPDTVDGVVHQQGQMFDVPYYRVDYSGIGYEPIDEAISMYFSGEYDYGSITSWYGTGTENIFYSV